MRVDMLLATARTHTKMAESHQTTTTATTKYYYADRFPSDLIIHMFSYVTEGSCVLRCQRVVVDEAEPDVLDERFLRPVPIPPSTADTHAHETLRMKILGQHLARDSGTSDVTVRVALHLASESEKPFVMDLDLDEFGAPYKECLATHTNNDTLVCDTCWRQLMAAATIYSDVFAVLCEQFGFGKVPLLFCFSGRRGLHVFAHPSANCRLLSKQVRISMIEIITYHWHTYARPRALDAALGLVRGAPLWLQKMAPYFGKHRKQPLVGSPMDIPASTETSSKNIRLPFSAHLKTTAASTPFWVYDSGGVDPLIIPTLHPDQFTIQWTDRANPSQPGTETRLTASRDIFTRWLQQQQQQPQTHPFSKEKTCIT